MLDVGCSPILHHADPTSGLVSLSPIFTSMLDVECWMLDVLRFSATPILRYSHTPTRQPAGQGFYNSAAPYCPLFLDCLFRSVTAPPQTAGDLSQTDIVLIPTADELTFFFGHAGISHVVLLVLRHNTKNAAYRVTISITKCCVVMAGRAREALKRDEQCKAIREFGCGYNAALGKKVNA